MNLVRVHAQQIEHICVVVVVKLRLHCKVEPAVLGNKVPRLHIFVGLREGFNVNSAEFVRLAVIENAGFGGVAFVADTPGDFKAEDVLFAVFVGEIG